MKQFLLKEEPDKKGVVRLRDEDYHYLVNVRRLKPGNVFTASLPGNSSASAPVTLTVLSIGTHILTASVGKKQPASIVKQETFLPAIILFQALPKGTKMDLIVRQAAEAEIAEVVPFVSEYSIPKKNPGDKRAERWRRIVKEARQQSGSAVATAIHEVLETGELFDYWQKLQTANQTPAEALGLILSPLTAMESAGALISHSPLAQGGFHRYLYKKPSLLVLAVGPEGGFSGGELKRFIETGFKAINLGNTVLRTETAAIYGIAAAKIILMERAWWKAALQ